MRVPPTVIPPRSTTVVQLRLSHEAPTAPGRGAVRLLVSNTTVTETGTPLELPFEFELHP
jgi:hypothetical protein